MEMDGNLKNLAKFFKFVLYVLENRDPFEKSFHSFSLVFLEPFYG